MLENALAFIIGWCITWTILSSFAKSKPSFWDILFAFGAAVSFPLYVIVTTNKFAAILQHG